MRGVAYASHLMFYVFTAMETKHVGRSTLSRGIH